KAREQHISRALDRFWHDLRPPALEERPRHQTVLHGEDAEEHDVDDQWGGPVGIEQIAPSRARDSQFRDWWATYQRRSASPAAALALARMNTSIDVREFLSKIRVPTLVMHRRDDRDAGMEEGRYIADRIPGAQFVELDGEDHL